MVGGVSAAWAVTDNANPVSVNVTLSDTVNVTFLNKDGSTYRTFPIVRGSTIGESIPDPSNFSSYVFDGWAEDNVSYTKTSDNFATKVYTDDKTYYPRFASYGYKIGNGDVEALPNEWDINNNVTIPHNGSLVLGTAVYGKTELENTTSSVTIPYAGGYALVCGEHGEDWNPNDRTKSATLSNWHIERYLTVAKTTGWDGKLFARLKKSNTHQDRFLTSISGNNYYVYVPYDYVSVNFGSVDNSVQTVPEDLNATSRHLDAISFDDTSSFSLPGIAYYLTGDFGPNWGIDPSYVLTADTSNHYTISNVSLSAGAKLQVRNNTNNWFTSTAWSGCGFSNDSDGNVVVPSTGYYDISFYVVGDNNNHIVIDEAYIPTTFNVTYPDGGNIYIAGEFNSWNTTQYKMNSTGSGTYSLTINLPKSASSDFKFVLDGDMNALNTSNRQYTIGETYSYTYEPSGPTMYTITFNVNYGTNYGDSLFVTGSFCNWKCNNTYTLNWTTGNNWVGSFDFEEGTEFKVVVGPSSGGEVSRWSSGGNLVADSNKTISSVNW